MMIFPKRLSNKGAEFIAAYEGFSAVAYNDAANNATIGFGHLLHMGPMTPQDRTRRMTREAALALLEQDAQRAADAVVKLVRPRILSQARFDALVSFTFNVGVGAFQGSTLLKKLNSGPLRKGAADEFIKWNRAGGRVLAGLTTRRQAERRLFETGRYK